MPTATLPTPTATPTPTPTATPTPTEPAPPSGTARFGVGGATLSPASKTLLQDVAKYLKAHPKASVRLVGHTDSIGTDQSNLVLARNRALAAAAYLRSLGVSAGRITTIARGESEPIADNATAEGRAANRRVEITIVVGT